MVTVGVSYHQLARYTHPLFFFSFFFSLSISPSLSTIFFVEYVIGRCDVVGETVMSLSVLRGQLKRENYFYMSSKNTLYVQSLYKTNKIKWTLFYSSHEGFLWSRAYSRGLWGGGELPPPNKFGVFFTMDSPPKKKFFLLVFPLFSQFSTLFCPVSEPHQRKFRSLPIYKGDFYTVPKIFFACGASLPYFFTREKKKNSRKTVLPPPKFENPES